MVGTAARKQLCKACLLALLLAFASSGDAAAEMRIYHLRVTLRSGERFETISTCDPINYCHNNGGSVIYLRDYSLMYSPQMKVKVLRTWIDKSGDLAARWREILRLNGMLAYNNHKPLPRVEPLSLSEMQQPE
ncbi:MAG: hypothetical protein Kow0099_34280 [Candidatus Abyssubacteria bacterium]